MKKIIKKTIGFTVSLLILMSMMGYNTIATVSATTDNLHYNYDVAAGNSFSVVLKDDGTVWTWGTNGVQLGRGQPIDATIPEKVPDLTDIIEVKAGANFVLALDSNRNVWSWGQNLYGQLGNKTNTSSSLPGKVQTTSGDLSNIIMISAGTDHCLAIDSSGNVWSWGNNGNGKLGDGTRVNKNYAVNIGLSGIAKIAAGGKHSLAINYAGELLSWGYGGYGQLGNGSTIDSTVPIIVTGITNALKIAAGLNHSLVATQTTVYGFGRNDFGQLGLGNLTVRINTPTPISLYNETSNDGNGNLVPVTFTNLEDVFAGENASFIKADGIVYSTGYDYYGQLGRTMLYTQKVNLAKPIVLMDVDKISISSTHVLAMKEGVVFGWGNNDQMQLDSFYIEKKGVPRQLKNRLNDFVGDNDQNANVLTSSTGEMKSSINYSNDIDMFKYQATKNGYLALEIKPTTNIGIDIIHNGTTVQTKTFDANFDYIITQAIDDGDSYYIKIYGEVPGEYSFKYTGLNDEEVLSASITYSDTNLQLSGVSGAGADKDILMRLYNPSSDMIDMIICHTDSTGTFLYQYPISNLTVSGTYQFIFSGEGTRNSVNVAYDNGLGTAYTPIYAGLAPAVNISNDAPQMNTYYNTYAAQPTNDAVFNMSITNNDASLCSVTYRVLQTDEFGSYKNLLGSTIPISAHKEQNYKITLLANEISLSDHFYVITSDLRNFVPYLGIEEVFPFAATSMTLSATDEELNETEHVSALLQALPIDEEMVEALEVIHEQNLREQSGEISDFTDNSMARAMQQPTSPYTRNAMLYHDGYGYSESTFRKSDFTYEAHLYNPSLTSETTFMLYASTYSDGDLLDLQVQSGIMPPGMDDIISFNRSVDEDGGVYFDNCDYFRGYMWRNFLTPLGPTVIYNKVAPIDGIEVDSSNRASAQFEYPATTPGYPFRGRINFMNDEDIISFVPDSVDMTIQAEPAMGEELHINVYDENWTLVATDVDQIPVEGAIYYISITGSDGLDYAITLE